MLLDFRIFLNPATMLNWDSEFQQLTYTVVQGNLPFSSFISKFLGNLLIQGSLFKISG